MIKQLLACAAIAAASFNASAAEITLWESTNADGDLLKWSSRIESAVISASKCADFAAGDEIRITVVKYDKSLDAYPQVALKAGDWTDLASGIVVSGKEMPAVVSFSLTGAQVSTMKSAGFYPTGCAAWITKMEYVSSGMTVDPDAIWYGEKTFPDESWWTSGEISIASSLFANAKAGDKLVFVYTGKTSSFILQPFFGGWEGEKLSTSDNASDFTIESDKTTIVLTDELIAGLQKGGMILQAGGCTLTSINLVAGGEPEKPVETEVIPIKVDGTNILLSSFEKYADTDKIRIELIIKSGDDVNTQPGWGVGTISPINMWGSDDKTYEFSCKEISAEGALNTYEFTVAEFKNFAKVNGEYHVDAYDQKGVSLNLWGGATLKSVSAIVSKDQSGIADVEINDENAPVEYFNLQGIRVENPANGIFIRRQGNKVSKVIVK